MLYSKGKIALAFVTLATIGLAVTLWQMPWRGSPYNASPVFGAAQTIQSLKTIDDKYAEVGRRAPAFGGIYLDRTDNNLAYVYLVDMTQLDAVIRAIKEVFGSAPPSVERYQALQGQFSFLQLKGWYDTLRPQTGIPEIVATDIDDKRNRILIGIASQEGEEAVRNLVNTLNIPSEAVITEVMPRAQPLTHTLESKRELFDGGLQGGMQIERDQGGACTLSYVGQTVNGLGFFTASHCTNIWGGVEGTIFHQPAPPNRRIGVENLDPPFLPPGGNCPAGKRCRYSDSAFALLDGGITASQGRIARTTGTGTIQVNHDNPNFRIINQAGQPPVGIVLDRMGRRTGWSWGDVANACVDTDVLNSDIRLFCQDWVTNTTGTFPEGGDSGSPVFRGTATPGDKEAYGILWGIAAPKWIFSNFVGITQELGAILVYEPGFGC